MKCGLSVAGRSAGEERLKPRTSIFEFTSVDTFLQKILENKRRKTSNYSIRNWSKRLGFSSHMNLSRAMSGKKILCEDEIAAICKYEKMTEKEQVYFRLLTSLQAAKTPEARLSIMREIGLIRPYRPMELIDETSFGRISNWLHLAILEATNLEGFWGTSEWIQGRLMWPIEISTIEKAISELYQLKLIEPSESKVFQKTRGGINRVESKSHSESIRHYHMTVNRLLETAILNMKPEERHPLSSTFSLPLEKIEEAQEIIEECHRRLLSLSSKQGSSVVLFTSTLLPLLNLKRGIG